MLCGSVLPRPHELGHGGGPRSASALAGRRSICPATSVKRAPERPGALRLHRVDARQSRRARRARPRRRSASEHALASAPPPTWTTSRSIVDAAPRRVDERARSRASSPPSTASPFRLPWQVNGARRPRSPRAARGRSGRRRRPASRGQTVTSRAELLEPRQHGRVGVGRDEDLRAPARPPRRRTAAASAAFPQLAIARSRRSRRIGQPEALGDLELEQHAEEVAGLVRARDVPGLVLDPDAARRAQKPSRSLSSSLRANGVTRTRGRRRPRPARRGRARARRTRRRTAARDARRGTSGAGVR